MMTKPRDVRPTLWSHGRKGDEDWMRVLADPKQDRVEVKYKDGRGTPRREYFPNDRKGRAAAIAWAEAFLAQRKLLGGRAKDTTHAALWKAYVNSPAWQALKETTKPSYIERWKHWERFRGAASKVDSTTLHHIDRYTTNAIEAGKAVNQVRNVLNVARVVYNWGMTRKLISENAFAGFRWKAPADYEESSPEEYSEAEFDALLGELGPADGRTWRAHVMLMLAGYHGQRGNALTHLAWPDVPLPAGVDLSVVSLLQFADRIVWPRAFQKNKKELVQPLTWEGLAALMTAAYWREAVGYEGRWVLFAGGGNKKLGAAVTQSARRRRRKTGTQVITPVRKARTPAQDTPYTYQAGWRQLVLAEPRAGVEHKERRAFHGFRKMSAGNVADRTGDTRLALEWIGDDIRQAPKYLKRRSERLDRAAAAAGGQQSAPSNGSRRSVRQVSQQPTNENGPAEAEPVTLETKGIYDEAP